MVDLASITAGVAAAKAGLDTLRAVLGLVQDVQKALPEGEKKEAVAVSLREAERQVRIAEAQIAQALGFKLCTCAFPPTPMLKVGRTTRAISPTDIHECPRCGQTDRHVVSYERFAPPRDVKPTT